jgi:hypothetical protein
MQSATNNPTAHAGAIAPWRRPSSLRGNFADAGTKPMHSNYRSNGGLDAIIFDHPRQRGTQEIRLQMASPAAKNVRFLLGPQGS